jgi:hypothetical protein
MAAARAGGPGHERRGDSHSDAMDVESNGDSPMSSPPAKDFLVSYTDEDERWAVWVAYELEEAGYSVVIQKWDFRPGSDFVAKMDDAVATCARTIAILSPAYQSATFTKPEWRAAFAEDPDGASRKLVPIRVTDCKPDGLLKTRVWIDLVGVDEAEARRRVLEGVREGRAKPEVPPNFPGALQHTLEKPDHFPGKLDRAVGGEGPAGPDLEDDDLAILVALSEFQDAPSDPQKGRHPLGGEELRAITGLAPDRMNDAVEILKGGGFIDVVETIGTWPFDFRTVALTATGRRRAAARKKSAAPGSPSAIRDEWVSYDFIERSGIAESLRREAYRVACPLQHEVASRKLDGWVVATVEHDGHPTTFKIHSGDPNDPHVLMKRLRPDLDQDEADQVAKKHFGVGAHVGAAGDAFEIRKLEPIPGISPEGAPTMRTSVLGRGPTRNRALLAAGATLPGEP